MGLLETIDVKWGPGILPGISWEAILVVGQAKPGIRLNLITPPKKKAVFFLCKWYLVSQLISKGVHPH